jgi:hypothetical protein
MAVLSHSFKTSNCLSYVLINAKMSRMCKQGSFYISRKKEILVPSLLAKTQLASIFVVGFLLLHRSQTKENFLLLNSNVKIFMNVMHIFCP